MNLALQLSQTREERLLHEIRAAIGATSTQDLQAWGGRTAVVLGEVTIRRGRNFGRLVGWIWNFLSTETESLLAAISRGTTLPHLGARAAAAQDQAKAIGRDFTSLYTTLSENLQNKPRQTAPKMVAGVLGFLVGSGGVDGDGGIPDLDFLGGIGAHRSILTHSVIAGVVVETLVLSVLDLAHTVHKNLPDNHDPFWEELNNAGSEVFAALSTGLSAGIAYHLGVDATLDADGTYKDLPVSLPHVGHQIIIGANAAAESTDVATRATAQTTTEIDGRVFETFRSAAEFAKRESGWTIVRASDGKGFRVLRKLTQSSKMPPRNSKARRS